MISLKLEDISVRFGTVTALDAATVDLFPGGVTMLAGPNGSGKSTLMGVVLGLIRRDSGRMLVDGVPRPSDRRFRERLGYLPEAVAFAPNLTARQVLSFFARARNVPLRRVDELLELVQLAQDGRRPVRGFSRGMIQRLGIAVAVLSEPDLLILDEPTGGLDQAGLAVLRTILDEWRSAGRFVLMASHDLVLMERRVDQVVMLASGRVRAAGSPRDLRMRINLPVRVHFEVAGAGTGAEGSIDAFLEKLRELSPSLLERDGATVTAETSADRLLSMLELPHRKPGVVRGVRVEEPGFDAVYDALLEEAT